MGSEAVFVALQIWAPLSCCLIEIVVADVSRDGGVHAAYEAVEDAFFNAGVVEGG